MELWEAGLFVGGIGDVGLQLANKLGFGNEGLKDYFRQQPPLISVFKAMLLTAFWSGVYSYFPKPSLLGFGLFAGGVDLLYRIGYRFLYPTLEDYYRKNGVLETILFNFLTAALVWEFARLF